MMKQADRKSQVVSLLCEIQELLEFLTDSEMENDKMADDQTDNGKISCFDSSQPEFSRQNSARQPLQPDNIIKRVVSYLSDRKTAGTMLQTAENEYQRMFRRGVESCIDHTFHYLSTNQENNFENHQFDGLMTTLFRISEN